MTGQDERYAEWMQLVADLLAVPHDVEFPRDPVAVQLRRTFSCQVSWNWRDADGAFGFALLDPHEGFPTPELVEFWARNGLDEHPLLRWFALSGDPTPMTVGRVPRDVVPAECFRLLRDQLEPYGYEQQLSIPYRLGAIHHRAFVLAKGGPDFSDEDLALARRIQPLLEVLERQRSLLRTRSSSLTDAGLTGRELAVLGLLAENRTAEAMAMRLGISPRTVHKHLEHVYRKLGVSGRLEAVLVATEAGVLPPPEVAEPRVALSVDAARVEPIWRGGWGSGLAPAAGDFSAGAVRIEPLPS